MGELHKKIKMICQETQTNFFKFNKKTKNSFFDQTADPQTSWYLVR